MSRCNQAVSVASTGAFAGVGLWAHLRLYGRRRSRVARRRWPLRLFALDELGEGGWLKAMRLEGYAP